MDANCLNLNTYQLPCGCWTTDGSHQPGCAYPDCGNVPDPKPETVVPETAVEAAAQALNDQFFKQEGKEPGEDYRNEARLAIAAALPALYADLRHHDARLETALRELASAVRDWIEDKDESIDRMESAAFAAFAALPEQEDEHAASLATDPNDSQTRGGTKR